MFGGNRKPYAKILESLSDLTNVLSYGSNWGNKMIRCFLVIPLLLLLLELADVLQGKRKP